VSGAEARVRPATTLDTQPVLAGELLTLRPLRPDEFDALYAVAADPLIWAQHPAGDRHEEPVFRQFFRDALASGGALVAVDNADGRVVGSSRYHAYDPVAREVEIGWTFLARSHWGGRHNGEMKRLMLRHAFGAVDRVLFCVGPHNLRSRRAVEKIGGTLLRAAADAPRGPRVVYAITAGAFAARDAG
jgi:RimJ/RimL family protein N-acetyltransferase